MTNLKLLFRQFHGTSLSRLLIAFFFLQKTNMFLQKKIYQNRYLIKSRCVFQICFCDTRPSNNIRYGGHDKDISFIFDRTVICKTNKYTVYAAGQQPSVCDRFLILSRSLVGGKEEFEEKRQTNFLASSEFTTNIH